MLTPQQEKMIKPYKDIKENGFTINLQGIAHGEEFPEFENVIKTIKTSKQTIKFVASITFSKSCNTDKKFIIKVREYIHKNNNYFMVTNNSCFEKIYHTEIINYYSFKKLKELCHKFTIAELKEIIVKDYDNYKRGVL